MDEKRRKNEQKAEESRTKLVELYSALKDAHFHHSSLLLQQEAVKCVVAVKKLKQKLQSTKESTIDGIFNYIFFILISTCNISLIIGRGC